jgi:hypothetical protein
MGGGLQNSMQRDKPNADVPDEPGSMEEADAANGETPADDHDEAHRTGEAQAEQNREDESPA